jgi:hypothetical protein
VILRLLKSDYNLLIWRNPAEVLKIKRRGVARG